MTQQHPDSHLRWYVVHTKPRQETRALENLERQGYPCYLPLIPTEKLLRGKLAITLEPLFPRYLFIQLGIAESAKGWGPIRSTKGVNQLVKFGEKPAIIDDGAVELLRSREHSGDTEPQRLFQPGERVQLTETPFKGFEGIYEMTDGESRVMVLIELLSKSVRVEVTPAGLKKLA